MSGDDEARAVDLDAAAPANELAEALGQASAQVAQLKRAAPRELDWRGLEQAFARSVTLAKSLRERLTEERASGEYASLTGVARDVVGRAEGARPRGVQLVSSLPRGAAIVGADASQLRRLVATMTEVAIEATDGTGRVEVALVDDGPEARIRRALRLEVRTTAEISELDPRIARLRPLVFAVGGSLQVRSPLRGGTILSVRLLAAC